eukprot:COSAG02_NODE_15604_length_1156_cov_2.255440_2_plen_67_part_00
MDKDKGMLMERQQRHHYDVADHLAAAQEFLTAAGQLSTVRTTATSSSSSSRSCSRLCLCPSRCLCR